MLEGNGKSLDRAGSVGKGSAVLQGWWVVAGNHRIIVGDSLNLVVLVSLSTPTHGHTLVTYTLIDNRTTSTVNRYNHRTTIKLNQRGLQKNQPTNFQIYTACCCSASNLAFHAFIPPYSPSRYMRITKYFNP